MDYSPWRCKESDTTERLSIHTHTHIYIYRVWEEVEKKELYVELKTEGFLKLRHIFYNRKFILF